MEKVMRAQCQGGLALSIGLRADLEQFPINLDGKLL
jgi:hypothetical protein